jgi:phage shock protein A
MLRSTITGAVSRVGAAVRGLFVDPSLRFAPRSQGGRMAGLMSRASLVVKSKFSKLLDRAEDPAETLDYSYEKQLELLQNVKRGIADVVTAKKRLELQEQQLQQSLVKLDSQAREALAAGREDLARQALERKSGLQQQLQSLDQQTQQLQQQQEKLVASEKALSAKVEAFRTQKETIKAQYSAAEAQVRIGEAATGIGEQMADTGLAIQRAKDKTEQMTARASAIDELTTSGALEDFTTDQTQLDRELSAIASKSQVDSELEQMKSELGKGDEKKELQP